MKFIYFLWDVLVPRFITEDVALQRRGYGMELNDFEIVCAMTDVQPGEVFDAIATVDSFQIFGIGFSYRVGNVRDWSKQ